MIRKFALLLALVASTAMPLAAHAESPKEVARTRKLALDYGKCVVKGHHEKASEAILSAANNKQITGKLNELISSDCLGSLAGDVSMRFPKDTFKYALADALVNADFASAGPATFDDRLPLAQPYGITPEDAAAQLAKARNDRQRKAVQADIDAARALAWFSGFGECVSRRDPVATRYWLLTPSDIPEENTRIKALQPAFGACLQQGTMKLNRSVMRGTVAINYYRLAMATVVPGAGSTH